MPQIYCCVSIGAIEGVRGLRNENGLTLFSGAEVKGPATGRERGEGGG